MKISTPFIAAACALALGGCASEDEINADGTERGVRGDTLALTLEGYGEFSGQAEYDVSEPVSGMTPEPELRLSASRIESGEWVTLTLGQPDLEDFKRRYVFPNGGDTFQVTLDGQVYEGQVGEVKLDAADGRWVGDFALSSLARDDDKGELGGDSVMLRGSFSIRQIDVNCHRLVADKGGTASSPGSAGGDPSPVWTPDVQGESAFCRRIKAALTAPAGT
jgi:hypothetical protein